MKKKTKKKAQNDLGELKVDVKKQKLKKKLKTREK